MEQRRNWDRFLGGSWREEERSHGLVIRALDDIRRLSCRAALLATLKTYLAHEYMPTN